MFNVRPFEMNFFRRCKFESWEDYVWAKMNLTEKFGNLMQLQNNVDFKIALQNCKISKVPLENLVQFLRDEGSFYVAS